MAPTVTIKELATKFPESKRLTNIFDIRANMLSVSGLVDDLQPRPGELRPESKLSETQWVTLNLMRQVEKSKKCLTEAMDDQYAMNHVVRCIQMALARKKDMM